MRPDVDHSLELRRTSIEGIIACTPRGFILRCLMETGYIEQVQALHGNFASGATISDHVQIYRESFPANCKKHNNLRRMLTIECKRSNVVEHEL